MVRSLTAMSKYFFWGLLVAVSFLAFRKGRLEERSAAVICLAASVVSFGLGRLLNTRFDSIAHGLLLIDVIVLTLFVAIALRSARYWPLWIAGLQFSTLLAHLFKAVDYELIPNVYAAAERFWSYPILIVILVAAWRSQRRHAEIERFDQLHAAG